jgi:hypothetical protein
VVLVMLISQLRSANLLRAPVLCLHRRSYRLMSTINSKDAVSPHHEIISKCEEINAKLIQKVNDRLRGPLDKSSSGGFKGTKLPMVLALGNHSSGTCAWHALSCKTCSRKTHFCCAFFLHVTGKSSFINYITGRKIQTTGVAPTDDSFTIIAPGISCHLHHLLNSTSYD